MGASYGLHGLTWALGWTCPLQDRNGFHIMLMVMVMDIIIMIVIILTGNSEGCGDNIHSQGTLACRGTILWKNGGCTT